MFGEILQKFSEKTPSTVMVRVLLEQLLNPEKLDQWFEVTRQAQYTRDILFSSLVGLMLQIVCKTQASVHAAYRHANIAASIVAVYAKLKGIELTTSQALVRYIAREAQALIVTMNGARLPLLPGYRLKYLDGNCLAASEHRLKPLRATAAGPLPGKSLVVVDPQLNMAIDVFPCADGHTQERALLGEVIPTVEAGDVWVADRNFCVSQFLFEIHRKQAFFIIRQHGNLNTNPLEKYKFIGASGLSWISVENFCFSIIGLRDFHQSVVRLSRRLWILQASDGWCIKRVPGEIQRDALKEMLGLENAVAAPLDHLNLVV
jgi:hypothetical protein